MTSQEPKIQTEPEAPAPLGGGLTKESTYSLIPSLAYAGAVLAALVAMADEKTVVPAPHKTPQAHITPAGPTPSSGGDRSGSTTGHKVVLTRTIDANPQAWKQLFSASPDVGQLVDASSVKRAARLVAKETKEGYKVRVEAQGFASDDDNTTVDGMRTGGLRVASPLNVQLATDRGHSAGGRLDHVLNANSSTKNVPISYKQGKEVLVTADQQQRIDEMAKHLGLSTVNLIEDYNRHSRPLPRAVSRYLFKVLNKNRRTDFTVIAEKTIPTHSSTSTPTSRPGKANTGHSHHTPTVPPLEIPILGGALAMPFWRRYSKGTLQPPEAPPVVKPPEPPDLNPSELPTLTPAEVPLQAPLDTSPTPPVEPSEIRHEPSPRRRAPKTAPLILARTKKDAWLKSDSKPREHLGQPALRRKQPNESNFSNSSKQRSSRQHGHRSSRK